MFLVDIRDVLYYGIFFIITLRLSFLLLMFTDLKELFGLH